MKKLTAILLALLLCSTLALPAAAAETELTITYERATPSYTLVVPQNQEVAADTQVNFGMVSVKDTANFWEYHLEVQVAASDFVGETTQRAYSAGLAYELSSGGLSGDGSPFTLFFYNVAEDGTLASVAKDASNNEVSGLYVQCYLDGLKAPSDTYKSTITYTAEAVLNR